MTKAVLRLENEKPLPTPPLCTSSSTCSSRCGVNVPMPTRPPDSARSGEPLRAWPIQLWNCGAFSVPTPICWNWMRERVVQVAQHHQRGELRAVLQPHAAEIVAVAHLQPLAGAQRIALRDAGTLRTSSLASGTLVPMPTLPPGAMNKFDSVASDCVMLKPAAPGIVLICHSTVPAADCSASAWPFGTTRADRQRMGEGGVFGADADLRVLLHDHAGHEVEIGAARVDGGRLQCALADHQPVRPQHRHAQQQLQVLAVQRIGLRRTSQRQHDALVGVVGAAGSLATRRAGRTAAGRR